MARSRKPLISATFVALLTLSALLIYTYFTVSTVILTNNSEMYLSNVKIELAGKLIWSGSLGTGETKTIYGRVDKDGTVAMTFIANGHVVRKEFGYVTPNDSARHKIFVSRKLEVSYRHE